MAVLWCSGDVYNGLSTLQQSCRKRQQIVARNGNEVTVSGNYVAVCRFNVAVSGNFIKRQQYVAVFD